MTVIAQIKVPVDEFALPDALPAVPEMYVEADRIAAHSPNTTLPCLWASGGDFDAFDAALGTDRSIAKVRDRAVFDGERLYHVEWTDGIDQFVQRVVDHEGSIVAANAQDDHWRFRIRFMSQEQFQAFQAFALEEELSFTLERLFNTERPRQRYGNVTPEQYEALVAGLQAGYFRVPRETTTEELADELGISRQSVSERIRRGTENLLRDALVVESDGART